MFKFEPKIGKPSSSIQQATLSIKATLDTDKSILKPITVNQDHTYSFTLFNSNISCGIYMIHGMNYVRSALKRLLLLKEQGYINDDHINDYLVEFNKVILSIAKIENHGLFHKYSYYLNDATSKTALFYENERIQKYINIMFDKFNPVLILQHAINPNTNNIITTLILNGKSYDG